MNSNQPKEEVIDLIKRNISHYQQAIGRLTKYINSCKENSISDNTKFEYWTRQIRISQNSLSRYNKLLENQQKQYNELLRVLDIMH